MNDFTKEELKEIQECLPFSCNRKLGFANKLHDKIQSMIDGYCEHENDERFCMMPLPGNPKMCTKCHGFYI